MKYGVIPATKWATLSDARANGIWVKNVFLHKKYVNGRDRAFDIALVQLQKSIPSNKFKKVKLTKPPKDKTEVKAVGYGAVNGAGKPSMRVRMVDVVLRNYKWCQKNYPFMSSLSSKRRSFCATSLDWPVGKTGTCYGDRGGPLFEKRQDGQLHQFGVNSFSPFGCAAYEGLTWFIKPNKFESEIRKLMQKGKKGPFTKFDGDRSKLQPPEF